MLGNLSEIVRNLISAGAFARTLMILPPLGYFHLQESHTQKLKVKGSEIKIDFWHHVEKVQLKSESNFDIMLKNSNTL